jgi:DNA polymerase-1
VHRFLEKSGQDAVRNRYAVSISGRKRYFSLPDPTDPMFRRQKAAIERAGKNAPIQGANADAIKKAMVYVIERLEKYGEDARLLLSVHDEVIVEARNDLVDEVKPIVEQSVKDGFDVFFDKVKMEAGACVADCWMKD